MRTLVHGTYSSYTNLRCRCDACRDAARRHMYKYMHADPERLVRHAERERARRAKKKAAG